jgi:anti-anti-sigma factor
MNRECKIKVHKGKEFVTVEVQGDLTSSAEKPMDKAYKEAYGHNPKKLLFKFDSTGRINSAGIALIINMVMESREKGCPVFITGVSKHFKKIFELVGLTKYTTIVDSEEEVAKL